MNQDLIRIVDNIARDKNIDKESILVDLEEAMVSAARKYFGDAESEITVNINRDTGAITAFKDNAEIDMKQLGRIPAQTASWPAVTMVKNSRRLLTSFLRFRLVSPHNPCDLCHSYFLQKLGSRTISTV